MRCDYNESVDVLSPICSKPEVSYIMIYLLFNINRIDSMEKDSWLGRFGIGLE